MANVELILLQRVEKLGQMGELVKVKPGYARNFLLPQAKAVRATKANKERFERERVQLEAQNLKRREEAERVAERVAGLTVTLIRQASESGALYGSVSSRDIAEAAIAAGLTITRNQVLLVHPIKTLGISPVRVELHPEVIIDIKVNAARSVEEAEKQARGEAIVQEAEEKPELGPLFGQEEQPKLKTRSWVFKKTSFTRRVEDVFVCVSFFCVMVSLAENLQKKGERRDLAMGKATGSHARQAGAPWGVPGHLARRHAQRIWKWRGIPGGNPDQGRSDPTRAGAQSRHDPG